MMTDRGQRFVHPELIGRNSENGTTTREWLSKRRSELENARRMAKLMQDSAARRVLPSIYSIEIPENASPELEEVLVERALLQNERVEVENRLRQSTSEERRAELAAWQLQNQGRIREHLGELGRIAAANASTLKGREESILGRDGMSRRPLPLAQRLRERAAQRASSGSDAQAENPAIAK